MMQRLVKTTILLGGLASAHKSDPLFDGYSLKLAAQELIPNIGETFAELSAEKKSADGASCKKCIGETAEGVMKHVFAMVDKKCEHVKPPTLELTASVTTLIATENKDGDVETSLSMTMYEPEELVDELADGDDDKKKPDGKDKKKHMEYFCHFWKKDREVAEGFLISMVRPVMDSFFYCLGNGQCKKEDSKALEDPELAKWEQVPESTANLDHLHFEDYDEDGEEDMEESEEFEEEIKEKMKAAEWTPISPEEHPHSVFARVVDFLLGHHHDENHDGKGKGKGDDDSKGKGKGKGDDDSKGKGKGKGDDDSKGKGKGKGDHDDSKGKGKGKGHDGICPKCFKKVMARVMKIAVKMAKKECATTDCPMTKAWCGWAKEHPKMAYGVLLGKVEPWKYAIGRCYHPKGKGKGKGHHHHHKGKGPHGKGRHHGHDGDDDKPLPPPVFKPFMLRGSVPEVQQSYGENGEAKVEMVRYI